jgi:hypothetical protein
MKKFFDFQIQIMGIWLNQYMSYGFQILTFDNCNIERSLFAICYQPDFKRLWLSICFVNFRIYF